MAVASSRYVLDTNIALYFLGNRLTEPFPPGIYFVSVITEIELLSYPDLKNAEAQSIKAFLSHLSIVSLEDKIKTLAIQLRQTHSLKLPDAIIAATTIYLDATLLTNDQKLTKLEDVKTQSLKMQ